MSWRTEFYGGPAWKATRRSVMQRDAFLCQDCAKAGKITPAALVHHIVPLTASNWTDPAISLNPENLVSLCVSCHAVRHGDKPHRYEVDELGHVRIL